jgi:membrane protease YdiL (CAAX protease family)
MVTTLLFVIWHLGYWDVVAQHMPAGASLSTLVHVMLMKMLIASIIGLAAGVLRWKTGNIYASLLIHAFWNLFGR